MKRTKKKYGGRKRDKIGTNNNKNKKKKNIKITSF